MNEQTGEMLDSVFISTPTIGALAEALAKAQAEMQAAKKDSTNPHFRSKYADLASVVEASRPLLAKHGIAVLQGTVAGGSLVTVATRLAHSSGEWIESSLTMQARDAAPQSLASAITYARRYGWSAMTGLASEEDDDGNAASMLTVAPPVAAPTDDKLRATKVTQGTTKGGKPYWMVEFSQGAPAKTWKPQLASLCEQLAQAGTVLTAVERKETKWGPELVNVRTEGTPPPPLSNEPPELTDADIPF